MQTTIQKYSYAFFVCFIFGISFLLFSSIRYPLLNSDNAVTVLMTHYFKMPNDLYFWGQDRLGSLIPLLGQIPNKIFGLSPLLSESIVHYLILLLGYLSFSSFIRSNFNKIIFAMIWFLPPMRLIDVTQFAFGIHYSLIGIVCFLIDRLDKSDFSENLLKYYLTFTLIVLLTITAIWVSDMAIVSTGLLIAINFYYFQKGKDRKSLRNRNSLVAFSLAGSIIGVVLIKYAKSFSSIQNNYSTFGEPEMIMKSVSIFSKTISDFLTFKTNDPGTSIYTYFAMALLTIVILSIKNFRADERTKKWVLYFILEAIILFGIILASKWTFLNSVPRRYFTCTYITLSFALILIIDNLDLTNKRKNLLKALSLITVITGFFSSVYYLRFEEPKSLTPMVTVLDDFKSLGKIGVISEYWNSYVTSCIDPDNIKATPHDQTYAVRNMKIVEEVFEQPNIYIIRDMWMDSFPDSLPQFNRMLVKAGNEFKMGDCFVCRYELRKN